MEEELAKKYYDKWYQEYIADVDLTKLKWIKLDHAELKEFYDENYYDSEAKYYAISSKKRGFIVSPFGLEITSFLFDMEQKKSKHILGIVPNNKGKYTIVCKIKFREDYMLCDTSSPYIYINCMEVNRFFRNMGISKRSVYQFYNLINMDKDIIMSDETDNGKECHVNENFCNTLHSLGYTGTIITESELYSPDFKLTLKN